MGSWCIALETMSGHLLWSMIMLEKRMHTKKKKKKSKTQLTKKKWCSNLGRRKPLLSFSGSQTELAPLSTSILSSTAQTSHSSLLGLPFKCLLEGKILGKNKNKTKSTQKLDQWLLGMEEEEGVGERVRRKGWEVLWE